MSRVVVAGGAGFIGAALCRRLLERGDEVVCVDNLVTGRVANVAGLGDRFHLVEADVCAPIDVAGPVDAVINLACPASPADFGPLALQILDVGSRGTASLLELAGGHGARFLQASTSEVYGDPLVHPQPESYFGNVNPVGPRAVYDEAKRFGEALCMAHHRSRGTDVRIVRIFNTYGPRMRPDDGRVVSNLIGQALTGAPLTVYGDGRQTRSFCFVEDLVGGILGVLASDHVGPVNLGTTDERPVIELAELIKEMTGSSSPIAFAPALADDPAQRRPDLGLAERLIGWAPATPLRDGLTRTVEWFSRRPSTRSAPEPDRPVSAVVVNYNAGAYLVACVASLRANGVSSIVVVDNGSTDGSRELLAAADPAAVWVGVGANLGYGRAANLGADRAPGEDLLICNPDLVLAEGAVAALRGRLDTQPRLGVVGPRLENPDGSLYPSARVFPDLVDAMGHGLLGSVAPRNRFTRRYRLLDWDHAAAAEVDWVSGACFLVRRELWDALGGFDPSYFMYMEDVDLCWRVHRRGWDVGYEPAAVVTHVQGVSANQRPYRMLAAHHWSMWRFARRTTTGLRRAALPVVGVGLAVRLVVVSARHLADVVRAEPAERLRPLP